MRFWNWRPIRKFYAAERNVEVEFKDGAMIVYDYTFEQRTVWHRADSH
jgi:hypothetical protein